MAVLGIPTTYNVQTSNDDSLMILCGSGMPVQALVDLAMS